MSAAKASDLDALADLKLGLRQLGAQPRLADQGTSSFP
jgi:hypothetical protein